MFQRIRYKMEIITSLSDLLHRENTYSCAIGVFDGMHAGHQSIVRSAIVSAKEAGHKSLVITFDGHPQNTKEHPHKVLLIQSVRERLAIMEAMGVDVVCLLPVTPETLSMMPSEFVKLLEDAHVVDVVVGTNFRFGYRAMGNVDMLMSLYTKGTIYSIPLLAWPKGSESTLSSSYIRELLLEGRMEEVEDTLLRPYAFYGTVEKGAQRGRTLHMPTANFFLEEDRVWPKYGVYLVQVHLSSGSYHGIANIGVLPTFSNEKRRIEVHIFDFNADIYGEEVWVEVLHFVREEMTFTHVEDLVHQMKQDVEEAQRYFQRVSKEEHL